MNKSHRKLPDTMSEALVYEEIVALRALLKDIIAADERIKLRTRQILERHFALNDLSLKIPYETYKSLARDLEISAPRVSSLAWQGMTHLRRNPLFIQTMNRYLTLFPYPRRGTRPSWFNEEWLLISLEKAE